MKTRKIWKKEAKVTLKKHYWLLLVICLFASFLGVEYGRSLGAVRARTIKSDADNVMAELLTDQEEQAKEEIAQKQEEIRKQDKNRYLGRSRGVFASLLNSYASGSFLVAGADALRNIVGSANVYKALLILAGLAVYAFIWLFLKQSYLVVMRRMVLESRIYEKIPLQRFLYPLQVKRWRKIAWIMFVRTVYQLLWSVTVIGGVIKSYAYRMVPYILAENPDLGANEAITLSRKIMHGQKWQLFLADLSFLGWEILNVLTLGISGIFYSNPYKAAFMGEFYTEIRNQAKEEQILGAEKLCDEALFEKISKERLMEVYPELSFIPEAAVQPPKGITGFLARVFGVQIFPSEKIQAYEEYQVKQYKAKQNQEILEGRIYPDKMAPVPAVHRQSVLSKMMPTRSYTVLHLILIFFAIAMAGWVWEVSLHLITDGEFVNRGVMHGPWLPIYGTGGILILIVLNWLRKNPAAEFVSAIVLCGCVEYYTAWNLEMTHNGQKWWDYSGYFLNLHGRICAEGLLVFGLGGLAIVYVVAPLLDNLLKKVNRRVLIVVAAVLLTVYVGDKLYSDKHPNMGKGITTVSIQMEEKTMHLCESDSTENANFSSVQILKQSI